MIDYEKVNFDEVDFSNMQFVDDNFFVIFEDETGATCFAFNEVSQIKVIKEYNYKIIDYAKNISETQRKVYGRPYTH